jgi:hypothetical protein
MHFINENTIKIEVSMTKTLGYFFLALLLPATLIYVLLFFEKLRSDTALMVMFSLFILISIISIINLIIFFINDFSRELIIDLKNKSILINKKKGIEQYSYSNNSKIIYVKSKWDNGNDVIGFFEYLIIDDKVVITNLSADLDHLIYMMNCKNIDRRKKWFTFIIR